MCAHGQRAQGGAQDGTQREIGRVQFQAARLDLGEVQDVVDDPEEGVRRRLDRRQVLPLVLGQEGVEGQVGHAEDGVHGRADLVADVGQELVLGPVGRLRRLLGPPQLFLLGPLSFGHIADEGDEQVLLAQADGGDADFGGELAAVAAQGRDLDDAVEQRALAGRQEASQAPAVSFAELRGDDGFGQDAADRLGPRPAEGDLGLAVPLGDEAVGAHGDEGVVGVVEDEAPALLAGAQLLLQPLALRDIINNRDVISGLAGRFPLERGEQFPPYKRTVLADVALLQPEGGRFALPQRRECVDAGG